MLPGGDNAASDSQQARLQLASEPAPSAKEMRWWLRPFTDRVHYDSSDVRVAAWPLLLRFFTLVAVLQLFPAIGSVFGMTTNPPGFWRWLWPSLMAAHSAWFLAWAYKQRNAHILNSWQKNIWTVRAWQLGLGLIWCVPAFWLVEHAQFQARTEHFMTVLVFCLVMGLFSFPLAYGYVRVAVVPVSAHVIASLTQPLPRTYVMMLLVSVAAIGIMVLTRSLRFQLIRYFGATLESKRLLEALGEEHLQNQAARVEAEATLGSVADGVVSTNPKLDITYINQQGAAMLGLETEELLGRNLLDEVPFLRRSQGLLVRAGGHKKQQIIREQQGVFSVDLNGGKEQRNFGFSANLISEGRQAGGLVVAFRDITERIAMQRELELRAITDPLTKLLNRDGFIHRLETTLDRVAVSAGCYALCYVDLDQVKVVNDSCGHSEGDRLLKQTAALFERNTSHGEHVARIGGDEFALLLSARKPAELLYKAREICRQVGLMGFVSDDKSFKTGASIGYLPLTLSHGGIETIFKQADFACHIAKKRGGRQVYEYRSSTELTRDYDSQLDWIGRIEDAVAHNRFRLFAQEICAVNEGYGKHLEILLSYRDDDGQYIGPAGIIIAAERYGVMPDIDRWVVENVLAQLGDLFRSGHAPDYDNICINLSALTLSREEMVDEIVLLVQNSGVPPGLICFEITETAALNALLPVDRFVRRLSGLGCRIALDDFGAGFSSFTALRELPIHMMKIDGALVRDINKDPICRVVVEGIVRVAKKMDIVTVAEWVEDADILSAVKELDVEYAQGFHLSKRLPLKAYLDESPKTPPRLQVVTA